MVNAGGDVCSTSGAELALVCVIVIMGAAEEISSLEGCQAHSQRAALQIYYYFYYYL